MKKYNCNNMLDYAHELKRMCNEFSICGNCPMAKFSCKAFDISEAQINIVQEWSDTHLEIMLTDEQLEILEALNLLGLKFIAKDSNGAVYAFAKCPEKWFQAWGVNDEYYDKYYDEYFDLKSKYLRAGVFDAISPLVSWDDKEPLNIEEVLKNGDNILQR